MDPLTQQLLQRQVAQPLQPSLQASVPTVSTMPPNVPAKIPTQMQRWANAQKIQDAYRNGWQPNPVLLQAQLSK